MGRAGRAFLVADEENPALILEELGQPPGGHNTAFIVVGGHIADIVASLKAGVDDDHGDFFPGGILDGPTEGPLIQRCKDDAVDSAADEVLNHCDLLSPVVFLLGAFPDDLDPEFLGGHQGAHVDRFPEFVGRPLGDHGELESRRSRGGRVLLAFSAAAGGSEEGEDERQRDGGSNFHARSISRLEGGVNQKPGREKERQAGTALPG
ncbi:MAG: hypothetical protein H6P98_3192, partial [Candidatus Aminicenantes bacterium]|nr:hypothetical protein [Candidatus Aminicenantes bacterium]